MYQTHGMEENKCTSSLEEIKGLNCCLQQLNEEINITRDESKLELELIKAKRVGLIKYSHVGTVLDPTVHACAMKVILFLKSHPNHHI